MVWLRVAPRRGGGQRWHGQRISGKQVCRRQERATLAALRGEVCAAAASAGCSTPYLSALCMKPSRLFNCTRLPAPLTGEVWPVGDM